MDAEKIRFKLGRSNCRETSIAGITPSLGFHTFPGKGYSVIVISLWPSLVVEIVKNLPAMQEIWVQSLGQEDPLEEGMPTHSSILAWRIPWTERGAW